MSTNILPMQQRQCFPCRPADAHWADGFIYVVEFSDSTIKVGRALDLSRRLSAHRSDARRFGLNITRWWGSDIHRGYDDTESALIKFSEANGNVQGGREYFTDLDFDTAVEFATSIQLSRTPAPLAAFEARESGERRQRERLDLTRQHASSHAYRCAQVRDRTVIATWMRENDMSQSRLARRAECSRQFIHQLLHGVRTACTPIIAERIEEALDVIPGTLFEFEAKEQAS